MPAGCLRRSGGAGVRGAGGPWAIGELRSLAEPHEEVKEGEEREESEEVTVGERRRRGARR